MGSIALPPRKSKQLMIENNVQRLAQENQQLKKEQEVLLSRVRLLVSNFPLGLIVLGEDQRVEAANNKALECLQYTGEQIVQRHISEIFPEIKSLKPDSQPTRLMARRSNGETFASEVSVNVFGSPGEERYFVSVQDITERFRLEQLRRDLIAIVSHDMRVPLTSVLLTLEMAKGEMFGPMSQRGHNCVARAVSVVEYMSALVTNLLDSEKADSGTLELIYGETTVGAIINKAIDAIPKGRESVSLETEFTNDVITVDGNRVIQVLINLISNAVKYTADNSSVRVVAGIEGVAVKFQVIDNGPGIPKDSQTFIFEKYRQLQQPESVQQNGFGLGLAICKSLVEAHKGRIWVDSEIDKGSKFTFTIPISPNN